jgi:hypothetical protein
MTLAFGIGGIRIVGDRQRNTRHTGKLDGARGEVRIAS